MATTQVGNTSKTAKLLIHKPVLYEDVFASLLCQALLGVQWQCSQIQGVHTCIPT